LLLCSNTDLHSLNIRSGKLSPFIRIDSNQVENIFSFVKSQYPDLVFLDIQMPDVHGLDLLRSLSQPPIIIITTAFDKYAAVSFDLDVADYLLKPFEFDRFEKAVKKAIQFKKFINEASVKDQSYFFVKANYELVKINFHITIPSNFYFRMIQSFKVTAPGTPKLKWFIIICI
jgi:two-component SAPR family response regulator